jgi:hypothetical protein
MRLIILFFILVPFSSEASFMFNYGLNYSKQTEDSDSEYATSRMFHKLYLGAAVNSKKTLFFGWNINSWSTALSTGGGEEDSYSMLEMGPKLTWFLNEGHNWYLALEWNPYAKGTRSKSGQEGEIQGSSMVVGAGYRFRINGQWGIGAGIHYHNLALKKETIDTTESDISDKISNIIPMLEISLITR